MVSVRLEFTVCTISLTVKAENLHFHQADVLLLNELTNGEKKPENNAELVSAGTRSRK